MGGRVTAGVVRVGDTVRRPPTPNSDFVRRLLQHLAARGFDGAPRALGVDETGRDMFSFIEGDVPADLGFYDDDILTRAAALIRRYHDCTADFLTAEAASAAGVEVVCHNDLSPCNFVFRDGVPVAIIDFDAAGLGSRLYELGYAAWLWLDLGAPDVSPVEQRRRLSLFRTAYGADRVENLLPAILQRQTVLSAQGRRSGDVAMASWAEDCLKWTLQHREILGGEG